MNYLKIENGQGYFLNKKSETVPLDMISKEDIYWLLEQVFEDSFSMDEYSETLIKNEAHKVIYRNLYNKLSELVVNKNNILDEINSLYTDAIEKYN